MLTYNDQPTIRWAVLKRLDGERGVKVHHIEIKDGGDFIGVGLILIVDGHLRLKSVFHLPVEFELPHLHNEIDQIAEQCKTARSVYWRAGRPEIMPDMTLAGTGTRGLWQRHGAGKSLDGS